MNKNRQIKRNECKKHLAKVSLIVIFGVLVSGTVFGGMMDDPCNIHSFNCCPERWQDGGGCAVCHTPHNAKSEITAAPLWNHDVTEQIFTPYSSSTMDADVGQPGGTSKLCLSCHDGTVALDSYGGKTGSNFEGDCGDFYHFSGDLTKEHPISFVYDSALAEKDKRLRDPATASSGLGGTIAEDFLSGNANNKLERSSCHDVHKPEQTLNRNSNYQLRVDRKDLCMTCHNM